MSKNWLNNQNYFRAVTSRCVSHHGEDDRGVYNMTQHGEQSMQTTQSCADLWLLPSTPTAIDFECGPFGLIRGVEVIDWTRTSRAVDC